MDRNNKHDAIRKSGSVKKVTQRCWGISITRQCKDIFFQGISTLDDLMSDPDELQQTLKFNMRTKNRFFDSSLSEFAVEKGPSKGFLHCHGVVSIKHRSSLQLSYIKFKQWIFRLVLPNSSLVWVIKSDQ